MKLYMGVSKKEITPEIGCQLYGYGLGSYSNSVHDPLESVAFVFGYGDIKFALISATVVAVGEEVANEIRHRIADKTDIPFENIMISATHTHTGPATKKSVGWGDVDRPYCEGIFIPQLVTATIEANASMVPVRMGVATGDSYVGMNRREFTDDNRITLGQNPWGCFNSKMTVISFCNEQNQIIANMVHYGCHGTAAGNRPEIGRDWPGVMTDRLEAETGAITAFFNGPEGDVGPRLANGKTIGCEDIKLMEDLGKQAGEDACLIHSCISEFKEVDLACKNSVVQIPQVDRISLEEAKAGLAQYEDSNVNTNMRQAGYFRSVIQSYEEGYKEKPYAEIPQILLRLGDVVFISSPYELFSEIGLRVQKMSPYPHSLFLINTNGTEAYFPTADQLCRGGYEVDMYLMTRVQPFREPADWSLISETVKNIKDMEE